MKLRDTIGLSYLMVVINDITGVMAAVTDQYGKSHDIRIDIRRGKGPYPRVGETWIVDRDVGPWTFAACLVPDIPKVTGTTDAIPALVSLIEALAALGLIEDHTTADRIRSLHEHFHPDGGPDSPV